MKTPAKEVPLGNQFFAGIKLHEFCGFGWFGENWVLLKSFVNCQFAKFGKFNSSKNLIFSNLQIKSLASLINTFF